MTTRQPGESLRDFMSRDPRGGGSKFERFDWKGRKEPVATVWLQGVFRGIWRHGFCRVHVHEDKATKVTTREIYYDPLVCYETDKDVLENQNWRDRETGRRVKPPTVCPLCLMIEHLHALVEDRKIDWRTPLFRFEGSDPAKTRIFHVGGVTGQFNSKKMPDAKKYELAGLLPDGVTADPKWSPAAKWHGPIYQSGDMPNVAFKQDIRPRCEYLISIVDNDDVAKGVQVTFETKSLGEKIHDVLQKSIKEARTARDENGDAGNIMKHPFAIRWEYDARNPVPAEKYDAMKMGLTPLTPAIAKLLGDPEPDVSKHAERFNLKTIRARLEQHLILPGLKQHLDKYFERALKLEAEQKANPPPLAEPRVSEVGTRVPAPAPLPAHSFVTVEDNDIFGCDKTPGCPGEMKATDTICPACGASYEVDAAPAPPPPKPPLPPRSGLSRPGVAAPPLPPGLAAAPEMSGPDPLQLAPENQGLDGPDLGGDAVGGGSTAWPGDPDDGIPF